MFLLITVSLTKMSFFAHSSWTSLVPGVFGMFERSVLPVAIHLLSILLCVVFLLGAIAYSTVFERKTIAILQNRRGPNRAGFFGLLQAIGDGVKLVTKAQVSKKQTSLYLYYFAPFCALFLSWFLAFFMSFAMFHDWSLYFILIWTSLNVYSLPIAGIVTSHSKFAFLGGIRSLAQLLSYELSLGVVFLIIVEYTSSPMLAQITEFQLNDVSLGYGLFPVFCLWFILLLAETNRVPFDLPEAEAELVAGFATEYSSFAFAAFFLAEYASMLVFSYLTALLFFSTYWTTALAVFFFFIFVWTRTTLPRFKIDQLLWLGWFLFLPLSLCLFVVYFYHLTLFNVVNALGVAFFAPVYCFQNNTVVSRFKKGKSTNNLNQLFSGSASFAARKKPSNAHNFLSRCYVGGGSWLFLPMFNLLFSLYQLITVSSYENYLFFIPHLESLGPLSYNSFGTILFALSSLVLFLVAVRTHRLRVTVCIFGLILMLLFLLRELFSFFFCFELLILPTLFLILNNRDSVQLPRASRILVLFSFLTMLLFLGVALYLSDLCGITTIDGILEVLEDFNDELLYNKVKHLLFFAFAFKMSLFPFHVWLPKAHVEGELAMSWILGGIVLKAGVFGVTIFCIIPFNGVTISPAFILVVLLGVFIPLILAITELHLKRMIAFFSISHMSFAVLLLLSFHEQMSVEELQLSICGMLLASLHSFISSMLFFLVDTFYQNTKTKNRLLFSAINEQPLVSILTLLFLLDNVGALPFSFNFYLEISAIIHLVHLNNFQLLLVAALYLLSSPVVGFAQLLRIWRIFKIQSSNLLYPESLLGTSFTTYNNSFYKLLAILFSTLYYLLAYSIGMHFQNMLFNTLVIFLI